MELQFNHPDAERFIKFVVLPESDEWIESDCWIWTGARHSKDRGYGKFRLDGKVTNAHKAAHIIFIGPVPDGKVVAHQCNNEMCCNPYHLRAQTQAENMRYCVECGRHSGFENSHQNS